MNEQVQVQTHLFHVTQVNITMHILVALRSPTYLDVTMAESLSCRASMQLLHTFGGPTKNRRDLLDLYPSDALGRENMKQPVR